MAEQRYPIPKACSYIVLAYRHLNKVRKTSFVLLQLGTVTIHDQNFIQATMYDKDIKQKFSVLVNERIFEGRKCVVNILDTEAKASPNLSDRDLIILRIARLIWRA